MDIDELWKRCKQSCVILRRGEAVLDANLPMMSSAITDSDISSIRSYWIWNWGTWWRRFRGFSWWLSRLRGGWQLWWKSHECRNCRSRIRTTHETFSEVSEGYDLGLQEKSLTTRQTRDSHSLRPVISRCTCWPFKSDHICFRIVYYTLCQYKQN
jgi:hypothetical protein